MTARPPSQQAREMAEQIDYVLRMPADSRARRIEAAAVHVQAFADAEVSRVKARILEQVRTAFVAGAAWSDVALKGEDEAEDFFGPTLSPEAEALRRYPTASVVWDEEV